jgi:pyruvate/2-oxoglutarate dehydrogenase complex dihydrolipoamide acyltransferase (E2) component
MANLIVPLDLWDEDAEGALSLWLVEDGDTVAAGDVVCEVMAEKISFDVTAPAAGKITLLKEPETPVKRGDVIARIDE